MATQNASDYGSTQYNVHVGGASGTLTNVAPSATSGIPLVSNGSSANPSFTTAVVAGGGTGLTSTTAYSVLCGGTTTTGALQSVASVGTTGQVLTSNGAGALPTFQAAAGGSSAITLVHTLTASSSASLAFTSTYITNTYPIYMLLFNRVLPATNTQALQMTFSTNNGSTYLSTNYQGGYITWSSGPSGSQSNQTSYAAISNSVSSTYGISGVLYLYGLATSAGTAPTWQGNFTGMANFGFTGGSNTGSSTVNNIKFAFASGNIASGTISLYGITQ